MREWDTFTWKQVGQALPGALITSTCSDSHVRLQRLSDRQTIATFQRSALWTSNIAFYIDVKSIPSGSQDKIISDWTVPKDALPEIPASAVQVSISKILALNTKSVTIQPSFTLSSASGTIFANRCKTKLEQMLWEAALLDAQK
ncbi:hypothetical protein BDR04DRAFT_1104217, partial [Suillus decipiens]